MRALVFVVGVLSVLLLLLGGVAATSCKRDLDCQQYDIGFCAGVHRCNRGTGRCEEIVAGPCAAHERCLHAQERCIARNCARDSDCNHHSFCDGDAHCNLQTGTCEAGMSPCTTGERCDERQRRCIGPVLPSESVHAESDPNVQGNVRGQISGVSPADASAFFMNPFFIAFLIALGAGIILCLISFCLCNGRRRRKPTVQELQTRQQTLLQPQ